MKELGLNPGPLVPQTTVQTTRPWLFGTKIMDQSNEDFRKGVFLVKIVKKANCRNFLTKDKKANQETDRFLL